MENTETDLYEILFEKYEAHEEDKREKIIEVSISELTAFNNHPFRVVQDDELKKLTESIKDYGVLSPAIVRPKKDGGYELISGHRRKLACESLGIEKLPALVREMTDEQAVIIMVDSNIQRENLLPSEKSFAYKMKLEALKHQGITSCQVGTKSRSDLELAEYANESARTIQRYIRLTELIQPILKMVDDKRIAFNPAVEISYFTEKEQRQLYDTMQSEQATPSLSQTQRMKKLSAVKKLTDAQIFHILTEEKGNQKEQIHFSKDSFARYFPKSYTEKQMEETIKNLLAQWQRKEQSQER